MGAKDLAEDRTEGLQQKKAIEECEDFNTRNRIDHALLCLWERSRRIAVNFFRATRGAKVRPYLAGQKGKAELTNIEKGERKRDKHTKGRKQPTQLAKK